MINTSAMDLIFVCAFYGLSVGALVLAVGSYSKRSRLTGDSGWLFDNFFEKLYDALFGNINPIKISKSFGLEYDKYMLDCTIVGKKPNFKKEAMMRVVGAFSFFFGLVIALVLYNAAPLVAGCALYILLCTRPVKSTHSAAERKKLLMQAEMPRFIDLLLSALEINLPIENAILQTAESVPCVLSDELKATFAETQIGAKNWQQALESIAEKYEIDQLSDFVLNIITAFNKGVSVTDAVAREATAVRQSALLMAKERTAKMTSTILFPLLFFKILPLLALLMVPIMSEAMSFYGGSSMF